MKLKITFVRAARTDKSRRELRLPPAARADPSGNLVAAPHNGTAPETNYSRRRWLAARSTAGAIHRQTSNAICTLNTASGSSKLCPQSSIAWATRY